MVEIARTEGLNGRGQALLDTILTMYQAEFGTEAGKFRATTTAEIESNMPGALTVMPTEAGMDYVNDRLIGVIDPEGKIAERMERGIRARLLELLNTGSLIGCWNREDLMGKNDVQVEAPLIEACRQLAEGLSLDGRNMTNPITGEIISAQGSRHGDAMTVWITSKTQRPALFGGTINFDKGTVGLENGNLDNLRRIARDFQWVPESE